MHGHNSRQRQQTREEENNCATLKTKGKKNTKRWLYFHNTSHPITHYEVDFSYSFDENALSNNSQYKSCECFLLCVDFALNVVLLVALFQKCVVCRKAINCCYLPIIYDDTVEKNIRTLNTNWNVEKNWPQITMF